MLVKRFKYEWIFIVLLFTVITAFCVLYIADPFKMDKETPHVHAIIILSIMFLLNLTNKRKLA